MRAGIPAVLKLTLFSVLVFCITPSTTGSQSLERVYFSATNSEDMNQALFRYGVEKGHFRKEGLELEYRFLPPNLALSALIAKDIDYVSQLGTVSQAALRGLPVRVIGVGYDRPFFYIMVQPGIKSAKDLIGKKFAVSSLRGTAARSARAALRELGLNPDRDVTTIVVGQSSTRMLAMEVRSVDASVFPPPWNFRLRQKGFTEMVFAGKHLIEPFVGIATTTEKLQSNPGQVKRFLRAFVRSLRTLRNERKEATAFIARTYKLEPDIAAEMIDATLQSLTKDGTVDAEVLRDFVKSIKEDIRLIKDVTLNDAVDFAPLREVLKEIGN